MHVSEGILSGGVLIGGALGTATGVKLGLEKITDKSLPKVALLAAGLFISSLIHIPVGPINLHLALTGIAGLLLGWQVFPALLVVLFLQSILFQFGGLTTLGINVLNLAVPALICYYLAQLLVDINEKNSIWLASVYFLCGSLAIVGSTLLVAASLALSGKEFLAVAKFAVISHLPLAIVEGLISSVALFFIKTIKPEMLKGDLY